MGHHDKQKRPSGRNDLKGGIRRWCTWLKFASGELCHPSGMQRCYRYAHALYGTCPLVVNECSRQRPWPLVEILSVRHQREAATNKRSVKSRSIIEFRPRNSHQLPLTFSLGKPAPLATMVLGKV